MGIYTHEKIMASISSIFSIRIPDIVVKRQKTPVHVQGLLPSHDAYQKVEQSFIRLYRPSLLNMT